MHVLFITDTNELLPLAQKVQRENHRVTLHVNRRAFAKHGIATGIHRTPFAGELCHNGTYDPARVRSLISEIKPDFVILDQGVASISPEIEEYWQTLESWGSDRWSKIIGQDKEYAEKVIKLGEIKPLPEGIYCGALWNGEDILCPHIMAQELGTMNKGLGEQIPSTITIRLVSKNFPIFRDSVLKFENILRRMKYRGQILIGKNLSLGFNLPHMACLSELFHCEIMDLITGKKVFKQKEKMAMAIRLTLPRSFKKTILLEDGAKNHLWLSNLSDNRYIYTDGTLGWCTGRGADKQDSPALNECRNRIFRTARNLIASGVDSLGYRTDSGYEAAKILETVIRKDKEESAIHFRQEE